MKRFTFLYFILAAVHCLFFIDSPSVAAAAVTKVLPLLIPSVLVYKRGGHPLVVAALVLSMIGDVAAELNFLENWRMPSQITFFAAAQVCYAAEFLRFRPKTSHTGGHVLSVLPFMMGVYGLLEVFTLVCASLQKREHKWCFVLGASVFLLSDSLILVRFLTGGFPCASLLVMATYYIAQYFLNIVILKKKIICNFVRFKYF